MFDDVRDQVRLKALNLDTSGENEEVIITEVSIKVN